jgi:hypothetical protein
VFLLSGISNAFERKKPQLSVISDQISKIENVTGWMKSPSSNWISRKNRIPKYMSNDYDILQDSEEYSLGIDNFQLLELREVKIEEQKYYLLLKHQKGGSYKYPNIKEDWSYNYQVRGYIF